MKTPGRALFPFLLATATAACGGADPAAKAPSPSLAPGQAPRQDEVRVQEAPRSIAEAEAAIARARDEIAAPAHKKEDARDADKAPGKPSGGPTGTREERLPSLCDSPCRALASMRRAVEALCRMSGESDARCGEARKTLGESASRVSTCTCEAR